MKTTFLPGSLSISRPSGGDGERYISIRIDDESSRTRQIEVRVSLADFTMAITGHGGIPCTFELGANHLAGMEFQHKTEFVPFADPYSNDREKRVKAALKPFEVDGWKGDVSDMTNGHRRENKDGVVGQNVIFRRHVNAKGEPL